MPIQARIAAVGLLLLSFACTDHGTGPAARGAAPLALRPHFSAAPSTFAATLPINRIRLTALDAATGARLDSLVVTVRPDDAEWQIPFEIVVTTPGQQVVVLIECINVTDGVESVEWSGRTAPITLNPAGTTQQTVTVTPGPPDNLLITSLTLADVPGSLVEGDTARLRADAVTSAAASPRLFWSSSDPAVFTVDATGLLRAVRPGSALVVVEAGPRSDTARVDVLQRPVSVAVTPGAATVEQLGGEAAFTAELLDPRGVPIAGASFNWSVADAAIAAHLGDGRFRALDTGATTVTATSAAVPALAGSAALTVTQRVTRVDVTPGDAVLDARGSTAAFTATAVDAGGAPVPGAVVTWASSAADVAVIDDAGIATAVDDGTTTISARVDDDVIGTATLRVQRVAAALSVVAGQAQSGMVGTVLPVAPTVRVSDAGGFAMPGVAVTFDVGAQSGSLAAAAAVTDADGVASAGAWTLGTQAGEQTVTASVAQLSAVFTATATPAPPAAMEAVAGDGQTGVVGSALPEAPAVRVTDALGNPVAGVSVGFAVGVGGGSVAAASAVTGADGVASAGAWTLGTVPGPNTLVASAAGVAGETLFSATATTGAPAALEIIAGDAQEGLAGETLPIEPTVRVRDAFGNPVADVLVSFIVVAGAGAVQPPDVLSGADGLAATVWTLGAGGANELAATVDVDGVAAVSFMALAHDPPAPPPAEVRVCASEVGSATITFATLAEAVAATADGGTIRLCEGVHDASNVDVDRALTIEPEPDAAVTIRGDGAQNGLLLRNPSGTLTVRGLHFANHGLHVLSVSAHAAVIIEDATFAVSGQSAVFVGASPHAAAHVSVRNSDAAGGQIGVFAASATRVDVLDSRFDGQTVSNIQYQAGVDGEILRNTVTECGTVGCVRVRGAGAVLVADNIIRTTPRAGNLQYGIVAGGLDVRVAHNHVEGLGVVEDSSNPNAYPIRGAGLVAMSDAAAPATATFTGNTVINAGSGIMSLLMSGDHPVHAAGSGNIVRSVAIAVAAPGGTLALHRSDFEQYAQAIGMGAVVTIAAGDLTCNWWGTAAGPQGVAAGVPMGAYAPFAATPIAGDAGVECDPAPVAEPASITMVAGNEQVAPPGTTLPVQPAVVVRDAADAPVPGVVVSFAVLGGGGHLADAATDAHVVTDADGIARTSWTLGPTVGVNTLSATVGTLSVSFTALAVEPDACPEPTPLPPDTPLTGSWETDCIRDDRPTHVFVMELTEADVVVIDLPEPAGYRVDLRLPGAPQFVVQYTTTGSLRFAEALPAGAYEVWVQPHPELAAASFTITRSGEPTGCAHIGARFPITVHAQIGTASCAAGDELFQQRWNILGTGAAQLRVSATQPVTIDAVEVGGVVVASTGAPHTDPVLTFVTGSSTSHFAVTGPAGTEYTLSYTDVQPPVSLEIEVGDGQTAEPGTAVDVPPAVVVRDAAETPVEGVPVTFTVQSGGGTVVGAEALTGADGVARAGGWTLGAEPGTNTLAAAVSGVEPVLFTATAEAATDPCAVTPLGLDAAVDGALGAASCLLDELRTDRYALELSAPAAFGTVLTGDFDMLQLVLLRAGEPLREIGGSSGELHGWWTLPAGSYELLVQTFDGSVASYQLATPPGPPQLCAPVFVVPDVPLAGAIAETDCEEPTGVWSDLYLLALAAGDAIRLVGSADVPVSLAVAGPDGVTIAASPEPALAGTVVFRAAQAGVHTLSVSSTAFGAYTGSIAQIVPPEGMVVHAGGGQTAPAGSALPVQPAVRVTTAAGDPVAGVGVIFSVVAGDGTLDGSGMAITDADGVATAGVWTLGAEPGANQLAAVAPAVGLGPLAITATGQALTPGALSMALVDRTFVGVSFTAQLEVSLDAPAGAGGVSVAVTSDDTDRLAIAEPGTVVIAEGQTSGTITVTGIAAGSATVRANADELPEATAAITVSLRLISLPGTLNVPFGHNASLPIQLAEPAPPGGTVVSLTSSDPSLVEVLTPTVTVAAGAMTANAVLYGALPGPATITASAFEYITGSSAATTRAELEVRTTTGGTQLTINEAFGGSIRLRLRSAGSEIAAPAPGVTVSLSAVDAGCAAVPATITIPTGLTQVLVPVAYGGETETMCTTRVHATGANLVTDSMTVRVDPAPNINMSNVNVVSGMQRSWSGSLGASNHGGRVVRVASPDPAKLLIAPNNSTVGSAFLDITVNDNTQIFSFWLQALEEVVDTLALSVTAEGFNDGGASVFIHPPALDLSGVPANTTTLSGESNIQVRIGRPNSIESGLTEAGSHQLRAGAEPLTVTIASSDTETADLRTGAGTGGSVTVQLQPGQWVTPFSVANGGVAVRPLGAGSATITATVPGYITTTNGARPVTVSAPNINLSNVNVVSGMQRSVGGSLSASSHGGKVVRVTSPDPAKLLIAPNNSTVGSAFLDITVNDNTQNFSFWLQAIEEVVDTLAVTLTADGFNDGGASVFIHPPALDLSGVPTSTTTLSGESNIQVRIGRPNSIESGLTEAGSHQLRAGAEPLTITIASSDTETADLRTDAGTGGSVTIQLQPGQWVTPFGGVAVRPLAAGSTTITATVPGYITTTNGARPVTVSAPNISMSNVNVVSGMQRLWSGTLGAASHGGRVVRVASPDPAKLLIAPNNSTVGSAFLDITVNNNVQTFSFWLQAVEEVVDTLALSVTAEGFNNGGASVFIHPPALDLSGVPPSTTTLSGESNIQVRIGRPNSNESGLTEVGSHQLRAGAEPLTITVASSTTAAQLVSNAVAGGAITLQLQPGQWATPFGVANGGGALRPFSAGSSVITGTAPGYITTGNGVRTVTVTAPGITINNAIVAAGLQRSWAGSLGAPNHGGVTVTVTSSNDDFVILAPDNATVGAASVDIFVPNNQTTFNFWIQAPEGVTGTIGLTVTANGFTDGTSTVEVVQPALDIVNLGLNLNTASPDNIFQVRVGRPNSSGTGLTEAGSLQVRAGASVEATVTSSDELVGLLISGADTARTLTVTIPAGSASSPFNIATGVAFQAVGAGATTVSSSIPGYTATDNASRTVNVTTATTTPLAVTVGAGLQLQAGVNLSGPNHGGMTARVTSADPSRLLVSPDANTPGAAFIDVPVAHGSSTFAYFVQGVEGAVAGTVDVVVSADGFTDGTVAMTIVQPAFALINVPTTRVAGSADANFQLRVGIPNSGETAFAQVQNVRAGSPGLTATLSSSDPAVAALVTGSGAGATAEVGVPAGSSVSPATVAAGGVAFRALTAGSTTVSGVLTGFIPLPAASVAVSVTGGQ